MAILTRIGPASAFKIGLAAYGVLGLVLGVLCSLLSLIASSFANTHLPFAGTVGMFAVILCPIVYGIIGGVGALVGALLYNLAAGWVGGMEVDIR